MCYIPVFLVVEIVPGTEQMNQVSESAILKLKDPEISLSAAHYHLSGYFTPALVGVVEDANDLHLPEID